jgi:hypothetical protein
MRCRPTYQTLITDVLWWCLIEAVSQRQQLRYPSRVISDPAMMGRVS